MTIIENDPKNLENEFLLGLKNQTVIADVFAQIKKKSQFLPKIKVVPVDGDIFKIVGLKNNEPKQFAWNYKEQEFGPSEVATYHGKIETKDKLIFYTVFSEAIETLALGGKTAPAIAEQTNQLSSKVATFYDKELTLNYISDDKRYHRDAIISLNAVQLNDVQLVAKILITVGFQMTVPSKKFNLQEDECNVENTKKIFCCLNYPLYSAMITSSLHTAPSPILSTLREVFEVIPVNMTNGSQAALIDSDGLFLAQGLNKRYLKLDEYVAAHKLLDHIWRKWVMVDFRPAFLIKCNDVDVSSILNTLLPKNILTDYAELSDKNGSMTKKQAEEWSDFGFDFNKTKEWIDVGILVSEAKFANWMAKTKATSETKYNNYADPEWCLNNLGSGDHKSIEDLRMEATEGTL